MVNAESTATEVVDVTVPTRRLEVHCLTARPPDGVAAADPVILLHGFPQTSYMWRHQIPALAAAGHRVWAPDTRGYGGTSRPEEPITRAILAQDVVDLLDALELERVVLVGHDWGGIIAVKAAIDHPDRFTRLGLVDTLCTVWAPYGAHGYWFKHDTLPEELFAEHATDVIEVLLGGRDGEVLGGRPASPWPFGPSRPRWLDEEALQHYVEAFRPPSVHATAIEYYRNALPFSRVIPDETAENGERYEHLSNEEVAAMWLHPGGFEQHPRHAEFLDFAPEDRHRTFAEPTLWVYQSQSGPLGGDGVTIDDEVPSGNPFADQFSRHFPDLRAVGIRSGHHIPEEAPVETSRVLLEFLAGRI